MHLLPRAAEHIARVLNTMAIFLSQCWRPEVYNEVASRTAHTWKAEEGSFLASSPFLVFPAVFGVSQSADSSFRMLPRSSTQHSTMSLWVCELHLFSYKDSNHIEFRPQPKPAQSHLHWTSTRLLLPVQLHCIYSHTTLSMSYFISSQKPIGLHSEVCDGHGFGRVWGLFT